MTTTLADRTRPDKTKQGKTRQRERQGTSFFKKHAPLQKERKLPLKMFMIQKESLKINALCY